MIIIIINLICWVITFVCIYILLNPKITILKNINISPFKKRIFEKSKNIDNIHKSVDEVKIRNVSKKSHNNFDVMIFNFNGSLNVGNIMRIACIYGVDTFHILGRKMYDSRSCVGSDKLINLKINKSIIKDMPDKACYPEIDYIKFSEYLEENKISPIFIEQGGTSILDFNFNELQLDNNKPVFIFGNETHGIDGKLLNYCKNLKGFKVLSIPQFGILKSLNVSNSASIILWEYFKSYEKRKVI